MARNSLWTRLQAIERKAPQPMVPMAIWHSVVASNPEPGGPPVNLGIANCTTINIPEQGYPALDEVWWPYATERPDPLTREDALQFFALTRTVRQSELRDIKESGLCIWRNAPGGPAVARSRCSEEPEYVQPLWPALC